MEFCIPVHTEDLELKKPDRFYIQTVVEIDSGTDVDGIIEGLLRASSSGPPLAATHMCAHWRHRENTTITRDAADCALCAGINDSLLNNSDIVEAVLSHDVYDNIYGLIKCVGGAWARRLGMGITATAR